LTNRAALAKEIGDNFKWLYFEKTGNNNGDKKRGICVNLNQKAGIELII